MKRWLSGVLLGLAVLLLLGFGAAAFAQEVPQESVETDTEEVVPEETSDDFSFVSEAVPAESETVTEREVLETAVEEPAVEEGSEESTTTEEVVEETSEPIPEPVAEEMPAAVSEALPAPELSTDKDDYHPGETATIFGTFFAPLKSFVIKVFGSDEQNQNYTETNEEVTTDEEGFFSFSYLLDSVYRPFYEVIVSTLEGEKVAETWFRDAAVADYDQCSNDDGDGYATGDTGCRFINGAINGNNSSYFEGDATLQRLVLDGFAPGSAHTVTLQYGTTKGGHHAYDFLTTWDHSEDWATLTDRCDGLAGCTTTSESAFPIPNDPNQSGQFQGTVGSREFVMRGGTLTGATTPSLSGSYAGDSETSITVSFTVPNSGPMCITKKVQGQDVTTCGVILWFGAHIAKTSDWQPFNGTTGAGSIQGSPYHVAITQLDGGSIGNRDNQMQADAIEVTSSIVIVKDAQPNNAQDFAFTTTGTGLSNFSLDDDADNTLSNTKTFTGLAAGSYTVTEALTSGWNLTNLTCVDPTSNTSVNVGTRQASINLAAGETVTCTYTNALQTGSLTIVKNTQGGDGSFDFDGTGTGLDADIDLSTVAGTASQTFTNLNSANTYTLTENVPEGWELISATCDNGETIDSINIDPGQTVTCTFTNGKLPTLTLLKVLPNDNGGDAQADDFQAYIDDEEVNWNMAYTLEVGAHNADEDTLPGYTPSSWTGTGCSAEGGVDLDYGDSVTCSITNDDEPATLSGYKFEDVNGNGNWDDGEPALSDWAINLDGDAEESDMTDENGYYEFAGLSKGDYIVTETQQDGWQQTTPNPEPIALDNGDEAENVNFGNFKLVSLFGSKYNDDEGDGAITGDAKLSGWTIRLYEVDGDDWNLVSETDTDGSGNYTFTGLFAGSYKVCEVLEEGWIQTFASVEVDNESANAEEEGQWCVTRNVTTSGSNPDAANFGNYEVQDLTVVKDANTTFTRTFNWTIDKSVTPETLNMFKGDSADVSYTVAVEKSAPVDSAWAVTGTITVTNPNPASTGLDTEVAVLDIVSGDIQADVECPSDVVPAGGSLECTYSVDLPDGEDRVNTVTVTTEGIVGGAENTANVDFGEPTTVVNNEITVDDTNGSSWDFSATGEVSYDATFTCDRDEGEHENTVTIEETGATDTATVTVNCYDIEIEKNANTTYTRTFPWDIEKTVDDEVVDLFEGDGQTVNYEVTVTKGEPVDSDFAVSGTITITNDAPIDATIASVVDTLPGALDMEVVCPGTAPYTVEADGGTLVCTYSVDLPDAEDRVNTATAALQNTPEGITNYSATTDVTFGDPSIVINDEVEVTDTMVEEALGTITASDVFEYTHAFMCDADEGSNPNTATVTGDEEKVLDTDTADVDVNCYDLAVTKDAQPSFTRTWTWDVEKTSATTELTLAPDQIYPVEYKVTVDASSADSDFAVSGTITIENPAPIDAELASVADAMGDIDAEVACPSMTVPANDTLVCTYTADLPNADTRSNTATVMLENDTEYSGDAEVNFADATMTEVDEEADLTDTLYGNLGTLNANIDALPQEFTYSMDIGPYPVEECGEEFVVDNTATATANDTDTQVSADHDVAVELACVCSLTQGFWKTHNADFWGGAPAYEGWENLGDIDGDLVAELQDETFYKSGKTWFEIFWTAPKGNVYFNMAHQYMAAKLNVLNGAYGPTINADLTAAETLLKTYTPAQIAALKGKNATTVSKQFNDLAGKLGAFNEGTTNPAGHCSEIPVN